MKTLPIFFAFFFCSFSFHKPAVQKVFDVHLHGARDAATQLLELENAGVYKAAISTSWNSQDSYRGKSKMNLLFGLMFPCPNGKVPYSLQPCYADAQDWPSLAWVETQIREGKIDFFGEILSQYYGISSSDSLLFPYYALAEEYKLPVGVHTGGAGPNHGSPNFKMELGNPLLLEKMLKQFPNLKVWIMHSGDQYHQETIVVMQRHKHVYADISVISNPDIVAPERFAGLMKSFVQEGLEDRLMFGTDNGNIQKVIATIEALPFLSKLQKDKIFYLNAERFFERTAPKK